MDILNEIAVLESAKANPYVVGLHEVYETSSEIILVLEWWVGAWDMKSIPERKSLANSVQN